MPRNPIKVLSQHKQTKHKTNDTKSKFTRMCIGEAIVSLMHDKDLNKITVSSVAKKAGVARMTFYLHYSTLEEALIDYVKLIMSDFWSATGNKSDIGHIRDYNHLLFALNFFDKYKDYFLTLSECGMHRLYLKGINEYMEANLSSTTHESIYELYCYSGGLINVFIKWNDSGRKETTEELARILYNLYHSS